jgi:hypothetical protein
MGKRKQTKTVQNRVDRLPTLVVQRDYRGWTILRNEVRFWGEGPDGELTPPHGNLLDVELDINGRIDAIGTFDVDSVEARLRSVVRCEELVQRYFELRAPAIIIKRQLHRLAALAMAAAEEITDGWEPKPEHNWTFRRTVRREDPPAEEEEGERNGE